MITLLTLLPILKTLLISYLIFTFEPIKNFIINTIDEHFEKIPFNPKNYKHVLIDIFLSIYTCPYCIAFWITLLFTFNIYFAIINVIIVKLIKKYIPHIYD